jgi:hypothetical protein
MMLLLLALALQTAAPAPPPEAIGPDIVVDRYAGCGPRFAKTYIAPLGQPFRTDGRTDPMGVWFAQADTDHDGRLTIAEMQADGDRFFETLDKDHSGEIDPQEMSDYENFMAPEIKLYQPDQDRRAHNRKERKALKSAARERADYDVPYGAGQWASLNIPEPVNSADFDINRGVSKAELEQAAVKRFPLLDVSRHGYLTYDTLPKSPAQMEIDACRAAIDKKKR